MPVPVNLNREMSILHGRLYYDEFLVESDDGDIVRTELFQRKRRVEENLGIELDLRITVGTDEQDFWERHEVPDSFSAGRLLSEHRRQ